jgi:hypothetical protein
VALALVTVIAVAALAATLFLVRARNDLRRQLAGARADAAWLGEQLTRATAEGDELRAKQQWLTASNTRIVAEVETQRERADELALRLAAATAGAAAPSTPSAPAGDSDEPQVTAGAAEAGLWDVLLAHITRRWAAVVGVPPENRGVLDGPTAEQLAQALGRETERLREEVGVDVELTIDVPVEPVNRVAFLLSAVELLGVFAASAERVCVDLDGRLVLVGDGWDDPAGDLLAARKRALAAGARVGPVETGDDRVRLEVIA